MTSDTELDELDALIGTWRTEGEVFGDDGETPVARVDGYDRCEWLGRAFVIHRIDVEMGAERVQGLEVIGPYLGGRSFATRAYDHEGGEQTSTATVDGDGVWAGRTVPRPSCRSPRTARSRRSNGSAPSTAGRPGGRGCASRSRASSPRRDRSTHPAARLATLGSRS